MQPHAIFLVKRFALLCVFEKVWKISGRRIQKKISRRMRNLIIVGTDDFSLMIFHKLKKTGNFNIIAFSEERSRIRFNKIEGLPNVPFEDLEYKAPSEVVLLLIAMNGTESKELRDRLYNSAKAKGYHFLTYISPNANVIDTNAIGENTIVLSGSAIEQNVRIGSNCIIEQGVHIEQNSVIHDYDIIRSGVRIVEGSNIPENSVIG